MTRLSYIGQMSFPIAHPFQFAQAFALDIQGEFRYVISVKNGAVAQLGEQCVRNA